jgi:hypothetical protein
MLFGEKRMCSVELVKPSLSDYLCCGQAVTVKAIALLYPGIKSNTSTLTFHTYQDVGVVNKYAEYKASKTGVE